MPLPTRVVFNTLIDPTGQPLAGVTVKAQLLLPYPSRQYQAEEVPMTVTTTTDANGYWELALVPNDVLDNPMSYYIIEERAGEPPHRHAIRVPSGTTKVWIGDITLPEEPPCSPQLVAIMHNIVTSIRACDTGPMLKGDVHLIAGQYMRLESDYNQRSITLHNDPPYATTPPPPVGPQSQVGTSPFLARADHTHEGVHALRGGTNPYLTGDITLQAQSIGLDQDTTNKTITLTGVRLRANANPFMLGDITLQEGNGVRLTQDTQNKIITLKSTYAIYLSPNDFQFVGPVKQGPFPVATALPLQWKAYTEMMEAEVTAALQDNNLSTTVPLNSNNRLRIVLNEPDAIYQLRLYIATVRSPGVIYVQAYGGPPDRAQLNLFQSTLDASAVGWSSRRILAPLNTYELLLQTNPYYYYFSQGDVDIAEVQLVHSMEVPALWVGYYVDPETGQPAVGRYDGLIHTTVFLYAGWQYQWRAWWGIWEDPQWCAVQGRLYTPSGQRVDFQPLTNFSGDGMSLKVLEGTFPPITETGFYKIVWWLQSGTQPTPAYGADPHFCGMLIEFV